MSRSLKNIVYTIRRFLFEEDGAAATEYAMILGVLVVATIAAVAILGLNVADTTWAVSSELSHGADAAAGSFGAGDSRPGAAFVFP